MYKAGFVAFLLAVFAAVPVYAVESVYEEDPVPTEDDFAPVPEPPDLPPPVQSGEALEPEVRIIRREDATIEEYRINGRLYKVKVTPAVGPPYYLVDRNGDGRMVRMSELQEGFVVPQWVLFSW